MAITLESIAKKMGCEDPFHPPRSQIDDPFLIDDSIPSPYSVLSPEEHEFLFEELKRRMGV